MEPEEEQLDWERRLARPAGFAAFASGLLLLGGQLIYPVAVITDRPNSQAESLELLADTPAHALVPGILQALGYLAAALPLYYLYRAAKARRPELLSAARWFAIIGPVVTGVVLVVRQVLIVDAASEFDSENLPTGVEPGADGAAELVAVLLRANERGADLIRDVDGTPVLGIGQFGGVFILAFAFVLIALNAMRAGLLSRFMGYLGLAVGILQVLAVLGAIGSVVQIFWLLSLGPLLLNRWPGGRGPAWDTVEAVPWPSAMEQRAALEDEAEAEAEADADLDAKDDEPTATPHPVSRKRKKRKRR